MKGSIFGLLFYGWMILDEMCLIVGLICNLFCFFFFIRIDFYLFFVKCYIIVV